MEEERRLFYVALTRARISVELYFVTGMKENPALKSRFLEEIKTMESEVELEDEIDVSVKNITMRGITQINFIAGQKEQNFVLANDKKNADICFMQYSIYLDKNGNKKADDGDELLYESGLVQPGYAISRFSISRPLSEGTYSAVVVAQPYSLDKQLSKLNNMVFATEIIVKAPAK